MSTALYKKIAVGAGWMVMLRWADRIIALGSIAVLARLLLPADFGLVAYAMMFLTFLELFFLFSFEVALIREQDASADTYNTAWTLEVIKGFVLAGLILAGAPFAAAFFGEPEVKTILMLVAPYPILRGLENIGVVNFQKNLELHKDFYFRISVRVVGTIFTIVMAYSFRNYWALVLGTLLQGVLRVVLSYVMSPFRPRFSLSKFSGVFGFSKWILFQNFFSSLNVQFPAIIIGRYVTPQALAFYNLGVELANIVTTELGAPIRRALYPGVAKMKDDKQKVAQSILATLGIVVMVGLPATIGLGITAPLFVPILLGPNWLGLVPVLQVLTIYAITEIFYTNSHIIYYVENRPHITARLSVLRFLILVPSVMWFVPRYGAMGGALGLVAANWTLIFIDYTLMVRLSAVTVAGLLAATWRSIVSAAVMAGTVWWVIHGSVAPASPVFHLLLAVGAGVVSYAASIFLLWRLSGASDGPENLVARLLSGATSHPVAQRVLSKFRRVPQ
jgi:lipopolysaccharide exporter